MLRSPCEPQSSARGVSRGCSGSSGVGIEWAGLGERRAEGEIQGLAVRCTVGELWAACLLNFPNVAWNQEVCRPSLVHSLPLESPISLSLSLTHTHTHTRTHTGPVYRPSTVP